MSLPKFVILEYGEDMILQVRAVKKMEEYLEKEGDLVGIGFEDGSSYGVKRNKNSIRVYRQPMPSVQASK